MSIEGPTPAPEPAPYCPAPPAPPAPGPYSPPAPPDGEISPAPEGPDEGPAPPAGETTNTTCTDPPYATRTLPGLLGFGEMAAPETITVVPLGRVTL